MNKTLKLWGMPVLILIISLYGLISALIGDKIWDVVSCILLAVPVIIIIKNYYKKP